MNRTPVTDELPFAPRRKRPLSLWNPLDYLVLLYWVFFFPQALRWYMERFGTAPADAKILTVLRQDRVQRELMIQVAILLELANTGLVTLGIDALSHPVPWFLVFVGGSAAVGSLWYPEEWGVEKRLALGFAAANGLGAGIAMAAYIFITFDPGPQTPAITYIEPNAPALNAEGLLKGFLDFLRFGVFVGMVVGVASSFGSGAIFRAAEKAAIAAVVTVLLGVGFGVWLSVGFSVQIGAGIGASLLLLWPGFAAGAARLELLALAIVPTRRQRSNQLAVVIQRASPLPIPGLTDRLSERLRAEWNLGLELCEGLLRYSLQFIPVTAAISRGLEASDEARLLSRIVAWVDLGPYDWRAIRYQSASLRAGLSVAFWEGFFPVPRRWRPRIEDNLRYDTPARAACAGFWHLHEDEPDLAEQAFTHVRHIPFGEELHANAAALAAAARCGSFDKIGDWFLPKRSASTLLRPGVNSVLDRLGEIARDARLVLYSRSIRERNAALNRVNGALTALQDSLEACPRPERVVIERIVPRWKSMADCIAADVGTLVAREPVANPYITGAPVPPERLMGREGVFDQIRSAWAKSGQRDSLVVFGHRRMGKTSVMRNVLKFVTFDGDTARAFLNLQSVDWSAPLADLCYSVALVLWEADPSLCGEPRRETFDRNPIANLRGFLARLNQVGQRKRFVLVLDEYELLDEHLPADQSSRFIEQLRGLTQQYPWLVVALVGLHDLEERSASFYEAIYAWRRVRVSFLDADGVADVLQVEDDAFPLAYSPEAITRIHHLTGGQPFLVQLIGNDLVQGFNRRLREDLHPPSPTLMEADVEALLASGALYTEGTAYFQGIWQQAGAAPPGQQAVLDTLARHPEGLDAAALTQSTGLPEPELTAALNALRKHDVLIEEADRYRYSVELMRLWVAAGQMDGAHEDQRCH